MTTELIWTNDKERGFQLVEIVREEEEGIIIRSSPKSMRSDDKENEEWKVKSYEIHKSDKIENLDELTRILYYSNESVTNALHFRYDNDVFYTNCGLFLVSLNPFKDVKTDINEENLITKPHIFSIVKKAYDIVLSHEIDQSILISGVSGSGKTEASKIAVNYLCTIGKGDRKLEEKINDAGLILECFGNAQTLHNNNSSRFGKLTKIYLNKKGIVVGAEIKTYMLEKSRVCHTPSLEQNFHVFYYLIHSLEKNKDLIFMNGEEELSSNLNIDNLLHIQHRFISKETDESLFEQLKSRMKNLGFTDDILRQIFRSLLAILHLIHIEFNENDDGYSYIENENYIDIISSLLNINKDDLIKSLTSIEIKLANQSVPLTKMQSEISRDSLAQEIYNNIFHYIIERINKEISFDDDNDDDCDIDDCGYISILDISGYESINENGLEQLCINYTNDRFQQLFNEIIYKEQDIYNEELGWEMIEFDSELKEMISLIDNQKDGLFKILDDICYRENVDDSDLLNEIEFIMNNKEGSKKIIKIKDKDSLSVEIPHAPNNVIYKLDGFLLKNRDILSSSLESLMLSSKNDFIRDIFDKGKRNDEVRKKSLTKFHIQQLEDLLDAILETDYTFIKCIKPNQTNQENYFDKNYVSQQVQWSGIIETLKICSQGYQVHIPFDSFVRRYCSLLDNQSKLDNIDDDRKKSNYLLNEILGDEGGYIIGKTKVFLSNLSHFKIETLLKNKKNHGSKTNDDGGDDWLTRTKKTISWLFKGSS